MKRKRREGSGSCGRREERSGGLGEAEVEEEVDNERWEIVMWIRERKSKDGREERRVREKKKKR